MHKITALFLFLLCFQISFSQKKDFKDVSIDALISDTQYSSDSADNVELIWWIPTEYWEVVFANDKTVSEIEKNGIIEMLKDYLVIISIKGKVGLFGGITYETKDALKSMSSISYKGDTLALVDNSKLSPDLINFLSVIKPMLKNMLGAMGENMQIFLFENSKFKTVLPVDPYGTENILFELGDFKKNVQLPLGSLLKEKICPIDNVNHSGKWNFCPYHGDKLVFQK